MRNRIGIAASTGLGRAIGTSFGLDNEIGILSKSQTDLIYAIRNDFINEFDSEEKGYKLGGHDTCDFGWLSPTVFVCGYEASYQWERVLVFQFDFAHKEDSAIVTGTAFGPYGSDVAYTFKQLKDYKRRTKFTRFLNKWYDKLKEEFNGV